MLLAKGRDNACGFGGGFLYVLAAVLVKFRFNEVVILITSVTYIEDVVI